LQSTISGEFNSSMGTQVLHDVIKEIQSAKDYSISADYMAD